MYDLIIRHGAAFIVSFLLGYYFVFLVAQAARRFKILDMPDGAIKIHERPVPYLGGLAVFVAFIMSLGLFYPINHNIVWLLLASTMLLFIGLIDDLINLGPGQKLFGQIIATFCYLKGGFWLKNLFFSSQVNLLISFFWILSIINAFNLIDIMDGLSSLVAFFVAGGFFLIALVFQAYDITVLLLSFMGAILAFFLHNKPPAKIYLGDAGALFVGGFLSAIPFLFPWSARSAHAHYSVPVIFIVLLLELFFLIVIRTWLKIPFYKGSPHHFAIYLMKKGWSKQAILTFVMIFMLIAIFSALLFLLSLISMYVFFLIQILLVSIWVKTVFACRSNKDSN